MTAIDPNKVHFTGENSFLRLRTEAEGPETTVCAHWRTLISPAGPGTCLFLRSDATGDEVKLYADNIGMARWLQGELEAMLNPPFADTAMPIAEAAFSREGAFRETYREIVDSADGRIELSWSDMGEPFQLRLPPDNPDTGPWGGLQLPHTVPGPRHWRSRARAPRAQPTRTSCSSTRRAPAAWPGPRPGCAAKRHTMLPSVAVFAMGGTIAMAGRGERGVTPSLDAAALVGSGAAARRGGVDRGPDLPPAAEPRGHDRRSVRAWRTPSSRRWPTAPTGRW